VRELLSSGVDVVRLNLSHADPATHRRAASTAVQEARALGREVGVLVDLPGPKMRTGPIAGDAVTLQPGERLTLSRRDVLGDARRVSTSVEGLARMVKPGDSIFLADGEIVLEVDSVDRAGVQTSITRGGVLRSRKGMHVPAAERGMEAFTEGDRAALRVGLRLGAHLVGLSFVRDGSDVRCARDALPPHGRRPLIVAKIETRSAVESLDEIVREADAIMVARGDLGIQMGLAAVPLLQKEIIAACNKAGKPVITATQMLESMTRAPLPTRAEVADVANAVLDGTDALMLSEETAVGEHAPSAVTTMAQVAAEAERLARPTNVPSPRERPDERVSWAVARAAVAAAEDTSVAAILCPTRTGATPRRVAAFRPTMPIVGLSGRPETIGAMALVWGVIPLTVADAAEAIDARAEVERASRAVRRAGLVERGDLVAVVAGTPGPRAGRTDYVRIARA
jgi:pyruvate kinase